MEPATRRAMPGHPRRRSPDTPTPAAITLVEYRVAPGSDERFFAGRTGDAPAAGRRLEALHIDDPLDKPPDIDQPTYALALSLEDQTTGRSIYRMGQTPWLPPNEAGRIAIGLIIPAGFRLRVTIFNPHDTPLDVVLIFAPIPGRFERIAL